jgi:hypothetical protein
MAIRDHSALTSRTFEMSSKEAETLKSPACPPGLFRLSHRLVVAGWYERLFYFFTFFLISTL